MRLPGSRRHSVSHQRQRAFRTTIRNSEQKNIRIFGCSVVRKFDTALLAQHRLDLLRFGCVGLAGIDRPLFCAGLFDVTNCTSLSYR